VLFNFLKRVYFWAAIMNFTIVSDTFAPDMNGVAGTLLRLSRGLAGRGHDIQVITTTNEAPQSTEGGRVDVIGLRSIPVPGYSQLRMGLATRGWLRRQIRSHQPVAMYVAVESWLGLSAIRAAASAGVGVVSGFHTNFHTYSASYRLRLLGSIAARYLRWIHNLTRRTLAPSATTASQLTALGVKNVGVLGRGVDSELFHPRRRDHALRRTWGAGKNDPVAIFVSRIAPEKNLELAVRAFDRLTALDSRMRCVFVGDGPKAQAFKQHHPRFIHAGSRKGVDLATHYASADIFIFPSVTETYGNVLVEALASGLVTVSFDYAAAAEAVKNGVNGFVAPFGDEAAYLDATEMALKNWNSSAVRNAARTSVEELSWSSIVEQFEAELLNAKLSRT
jgi:glycosyltransferase involved in cell wall biosynthesis